MATTTLSKAEQALKAKIDSNKVRESLANATKTNPVQLELEEVDDYIETKGCGQLVSELIKALIDRGFSVAEFSRYSRFAESTIHKYAKGEVNDPNSGIIEVLRKYSRFESEAFYLYLKGKVTLELLLNKRNALRDKAVPKEILIDFKSLDFGDQVSLLQNLSEVLTESYTAIKLKTADKFNELTQQVQVLNTQVEEYKPKIEYFEIEGDTQTRLKNLIRITLMMNDLDETDLINKGVAGALLEAILQSKGNNFPKTDYDILAQNLNTVLGWSKALMPSVDPTSYYRDIDHLMAEFQKFK